MGIQKTVLKVHLNCAKCKKKLMKAVSEIEGVDKIEVDSGKETLTVIGNADPYAVILKARKAGKYAEVVSIGPPQGPSNKPDEKKKPADDTKKLEVTKKPPDHHQIVMPPHYVHAQWCNCPMCNNNNNMHMVQVYHYDEPSPTCSIM